MIASVDFEYFKNLKNNENINGNKTDNKVIDNENSKPKPKPNPNISQFIKLNNSKKIKYKLKNISHEEYLKNYSSEHFKAEFECSFDFLLFQFGNPYISDNSIIHTSFDSPNDLANNTPNDLANNTQNNLINKTPNDLAKNRASWFIKVKTSNGFEYFINIYDWDQLNIKLKDVKKWCIGSCNKSEEYLNWEKIIKLLNFLFLNYNKRINKLKNKELVQNIQPKLKQVQKNKTTSTINTTGIINTTGTICTTNPNIKITKKYIDEEKYDKINDEKLKDLSDNDLVCILFIRFKKNNNMLFKEILKIQEKIENSNSQIINDVKKSKSINIRTNTNLKKKSKYNIKNKFKYNNKKDK